MGYTTTFEGHVTIDPPLNEHEREYINRFSQTRRMDRDKGPYYANPGTDGVGQDHEADIRDYNRPPAGQPGLWCKWEVTEDGRAIQWSGAEKFYDSPEWMQYLIDHFLKEGAVVQRELLKRERSGIVLPNAVDDGLGDFDDFTFDHVVNGEIDAYGEEPGDIWRLVVTNNQVETKQGRMVYE